MIIKYFDEFEGTWIDITGATGSTLEYGPSGWTTTPEVGILNGSISQSGTNPPTLIINKDNKDIEGSLTITYDNVGEYTINSTSALFAVGGANAVPRQFLGTQTSVTDWVVFNIVRQDDYNIKIYTYKSGSLTDGMLTDTSFEFIFY